MTDLVERHCNICKRPLDNPSDPMSLDCGGDCLRCMAVIAEDPDCAKSCIEQLEAEVKTALHREAETTARYDAKIDALEAEIARKDALIEKAVQAGLDAGAEVVLEGEEDALHYIRILSASEIVKEMCGE